MREIKFRAFHKEKKEMMYKKFMDMMALASLHQMLNKIKDIEVMQFIGLRDKKDVEIFDGDIIMCKLTTDGQEHIVCSECGHAPVCKVEIYWDLSGFSGRIINKPDDYTGNYIDLGNCDDIQIIGNIYENPKLLKTKKEKK